MARSLNKDQFTYQKERDSFLKELQRFHTSRGTPFSRIPCIGGKPVDLYLLYAKVTGLGGREKVNNEIGWEEIQEYFHIPRACTNSGLALKNIYTRFLSIYEKLHHFGEEPNQRQDDEMDSHGQLSARKKSAALSANVPMAYNLQQHKLPDLVRKNLDLPQPLDQDQEYHKLEMALESGLPNEVDFVMNVCTLLSNEGKHILKVSRCPRVINLLMGHIGVFTPAVCPRPQAKGTGSLRQLHDEGWKPYTKGRNYQRFWYDSVEEGDIKRLISPDSLTMGMKTECHDSDPLHPECILAKVSEEDEEVLENVLHLGHDLGLKQVEGQRVIQVASILRNLSFEEENMETLANNLLVFRFLLLCIHSRYNNLRQLGLDTLGNLALKMVLDPVEYITTKLVLQTVHNSITSSDKFEVVSGMDLLSRLCQVDQNEELLSERVEERLYETIISMLTVHDIQLIVHTLEALYQLSELGPLTSTHIANVTAAIDILVSLVTVEAQSYGPGSLIGIKVVEQVPAGLVQQQSLQQQQIQAPQTPVRTAAQGTPQRTQMPPPPQHTPMTVATPPPPQAAAHRLPVAATPPAPSQPPSRPPAPVAGGGSSVGGVSVSTEGEAMACKWIQAHYEWSAEAVVTRMELYSHYFSTCTRQGTQSLANANTFANSVRLTFPRVEHQRIERTDGTVDIQYKGVKRRNVPLPFPPPTPQLSGGQSACTPLMRPPISTTVVSSPPPQTCTGQRGSDQWKPGPRPIVPAPPSMRGMLHSALQQRLASPPMSPPTQERPSGPISPTSYPTIQQALLHQPGSGPPPQHPGSPGPNSPTSGKPPDSNLIKSLLANKVTQNMHRLHQQQQGLGSQPLSGGQGTGQLHPALQPANPVQHHTQQTTQQPEKRAKKRKASSSPTPVEAKVAATSDPLVPGPVVPTSGVTTTTNPGCGLTGVTTTTNPGCGLTTTNPGCGLTTTNPGCGVPVTQGTGLTAPVACVWTNTSTTAMSVSSSPVPVSSMAAQDSTVSAMVSSGATQTSISTQGTTTGLPVSNSSPLVASTVTNIASLPTPVDEEKVPVSNAVSHESNSMEQKEVESMDTHIEMAVKSEMDATLKACSTQQDKSDTSNPNHVTPQCPGSTNCGSLSTTSTNSETSTVSLPKCSGGHSSVLVNSLGSVSCGIPGQVNGVGERASQEEAMDTSQPPLPKGVNGGKAQEPLVNGLCSPAPSEETDPHGKDLIPQTVLDIQEIKKEISMAGKKQISALLSENNKAIKEQLFGLNGLVNNHLGNGDCHVALLKDNNGKAEGDKQGAPKPNQTALSVENGYPSPASSSSDQPCRPNGGPDTPLTDCSQPQADHITARGATSSLSTNPVGPSNVQQDAQSLGASLSQQPDASPLSDLRTSGQCAPPTAVHPATAASTHLPSLPAVPPGTHAHLNTSEDQPVATPATHTTASTHTTAPTQDILAVAMQQTLDIPAATTIFSGSLPPYTPADQAQPPASQSVLVSQLQSKPLASQPVVLPQVVSQALQPQLAVRQIQIPVSQLQAASQPHHGQPQVILQPQQAGGQVQSVGQPQQAAGQPQQAVSNPQQALGQPQQAVSNPQQAVGQPPQLILQPQQAVGQQQQAVINPHQAVINQQQAVGQPHQAISHPQRVVFVQQNGQQVPMVVQQQGIQGQLLPPGVIHSGGQVIHTSQGQMIQTTQVIHSSQAGQAISSMGQNVVLASQTQTAPTQMCQASQPGSIQASQTTLQASQPQIMQVTQPQVAPVPLSQASLASQPQMVQAAQPQMVQASQPHIQMVQASQPQMVQASQPQMVQASQPQMVQASHGQIAQTGQLVQTGQVMMSSVQQTPNVQIISQPAVVSQGLVSQALVSQGLVSQGLMVVSVPGGQTQTGWATAPLNPQTFTQQMVAAQKLPQPAPVVGQTLQAVALPQIAPRPQMVVVSQSTGPNNILQQQLQMPTTPMAPQVPKKSGTPGPVTSQAAPPHPPGPASPSTIQLTSQTPSTPTTAKSAKKRKAPAKKGQQRKGSTETKAGGTPTSAQGQAAAPPVPQLPLRYWCDWKGCNRCFETWQAVSLHALAVHFHKSIPFVICQWDGCDGLRRAKWSFMTHLQDRHLTEAALRASAIKRQQQPAAGPTPPAPAPPPQPSAPPVYPNDAAYQAIRRFSARPPYPEFAEMKEGPVTKHIRLTSALILRNLARYSAQGRSIIKRHEEHLSYVALSNVESSNALSNCLWELHAAQ